MKVVYDTCLYVDLLRGSHAHAFFKDRSHIRYLSPIVMMELLAGGRTAPQKRTLSRLIEPYTKANRIIPLTSGLYHKAGQTLAELNIDRRAIGKGFSHDLLIALSAMSIGATLFTSNKKDFDSISGVLPLKLEYV